MDVGESREMMVRQATGMVVSMVSVVVSTLKRLRDEPEPDTEPNPLLCSLRADAEEHRQRTLQTIYNSTDVECVSMLRMRRKPFFCLCETFRSRGLMHDNIGVSVEEQVAMFLHVVGHNQRFRVVHQSFRRPIETIHKHFHQVLFAICELRSEMIKPPSTTTHPNILGSHRWNPYCR
jgi:hypothetical protein